MAARKKTARKKTARRKVAKKTARKKTTRKKTSSRSILGDELPKSLKAFGAQLRRDMNAVERQIESASRASRRSLARVVRDASHQLGHLEARGQKEWHALSKRTEAEARKTLRKVRKAAGR